MRKREFRKLWIMRINAGARAHGLSYNQFMHGLKAANVELDRKVLADIAVADPAKFGEIVEQAKSALAGAAKRQSRDLQPPGRLRRPFACTRTVSPLAKDPRVGDIAPDVAWDLPLRLLAGLHYLVLGDLASWDDVDGALDRHAAFLSRWAAEQDVQTNEVQRAWGLLPAFLFVADERPFDLLELGPSAGQPLWDHPLPVLERGWGSYALSSPATGAAAPRYSTEVSRSRAGAASSSVRST